jgi:hypothetical protein
MKQERKGQNLSQPHGADLAYPDAVGLLLPPAHAHTHLIKVIKRKKDQEVRKAMGKKLKAMGKKLQAMGKMKVNLRKAQKFQTTRIVMKILQLE